MLHVGIDATSLLGPRTGVGTFTEALVVGMAGRADRHCTAFAVTWRGRSELRGQLPGGVRCVDRPMPARPLRFAWRQIGGPPIEWWTGPLDVVHGPNFVVPPTRRSARLVTVHDLTAVHHPQWCTRDVLAWPPLLVRSLRDGAWVHTPSEAVRAEVIDHFDVDPGRVVAVANGFSPMPPADPTAGHRLVGGARYLLTLGTVEPRKNLPTLVAAFDRLAERDTELRLVLAGPDGWGTDALDRARERAHHSDRIIRLGWVEPHQRAALLRGAAAFVYPSSYEGFGLPVLEAMSADVPVVAVASAAVAEVAGEAAALVPPESATDAEALADTVAGVIDDRACAEGLVRRGRARLGAFSWDAMVAGLADLHRLVADAG